MNKLFFAIVMLFFFNSAFSQQTDSLFKAANRFIMAGDAENAQATLKRLEKLLPEDNEVNKLFAFSYYNQRDFASALPYANKIAASSNADFQQIQMAGMVYKAIAMYKDAERLYKKALAQFPENGTLLSEYGELLQQKNEASKAIQMWEKGIASDPNISSNYYFAAKYYSAAGKLVRAVLYAEIFMNLESFSERTNEMRTQLVSDYKKLLQGAAKPPPTDAFASAFYTTLSHYANFVSTGVNATALHNVRTYFLKEWNQQHANLYPFQLFTYHQELADRELFEAYNQWLFSNRSDFNEWGKLNQSAYNSFIQLQNSRVFKIPAGQYFSH